ncbi:hypothetical protein LX87_05364 [Larkinella arboricola]|uniref:Thioredoxin-like protein n=1 Tax=Larkinella arboricola TaxID=643671 RepID=A0A327WJN7_LARAB|nr:hypothetical protein [Larkinella arboricola]RAJ91023.1 hypothetical protein LX87_05364 [Larkinella arboricola]
MTSFFQRLLTGLSRPTLHGGPLAGVRYFEGSWQQLLTEAKRLNKPVFLDFYTMGYYPRQQTAQETVCDSSLARTFNAHFINYLVDAQEEEGDQIAHRYRMHQSAVPTALFILWDGSPVHRAEGYQGLQGLLAEAGKAIEAARQRNQLSVLEQDYQAGLRDPVFLATYLNERSRWKMPNQEALLAYLSLVPQTEWTSDDTIPLIMGNLVTYQPGPVDALLQKLGLLSQSPDRSCSSLPRQIGECIRELARTQFGQAVTGQDEQLVEAVIACHQRLLKAERGESLPEEEVERVASGYRRRFYAETKNFEKYRPLAEAEAWRLMTIPVASVHQKDKLEYQRFLERQKQLEKKGHQPDYIKYAYAMSTMESRDMAHRLNGLVQYYAENFTDAQDLEQALAWSARCLEYDTCPGYLHLHTRLLIKLGRPQEADEVLSQMSTEQAPGVYQITLVSKIPEEYDR